MRQLRICRPPMVCFESVLTQSLSSNRLSAYHLSGISISDYSYTAKGASDLITLENWSSMARWLDLQSKFQGFQGFGVLHGSCLGGWPCSDRGCGVGMWLAADGCRHGRINPASCSGRSAVVMPCARRWQRRIYLNWNIR